MTGKNILNSSMKINGNNIREFKKKYDLFIIIYFNEHFMVVAIFIS